MARLILSELIDHAQDVKTSYPQAKVVRAANLVIRRIHAETTIPQYSTFTTRAKVTTGTVAVVQGATSATFSASVLSSTDPLVLVQIEGDEAWFVCTRNGADTIGTLSSNWGEATDTAATYTLVYPTVSFGASVGEILRIWRPGESDLEYASDRGADDARDVANVTGTPRRWCPYLHDSSSTPDDALRILLDPAPESREVWQYAFRTRPTLLTVGGATSQTIPLPDLWHEAVIAGVLADVYEVRDGLEKAQAKRAEYEAIFRRTRSTTLPAAVVGPRRDRNLTVFSPRPTNA